MSRRSAMMRGAIGGLLVGAVASLGIVATSAQSTPDPDETVTIAPGTIFEIIADTGSNRASVNWILLKDEQFLEAQRLQHFSFRPAGSGTYVLRAEVIGRDNNIQRRIIAIRVQEGAAQPQAGKSEQVFFNFHPSAPQDGMIVLPPSTRLLRVDPLSDSIEQVFLDLHTAVDSNGDGNPFNDNALPGTAFRTGRTSLHVWFPSPPQNQPIALGASLTTGRIITVELTVTSGTVAMPQRPPPVGLERTDLGPLRIVSEDRGDNLYAFTVQGGRETLPDAPFLLHWNFGDGEQSMLDRPLKRYAEAGSYAVSATVRNLDTGEEVATLRKTVAVTATTAGRAGEAGDQERRAREEEKGTKISGSTFWLTVKVLLVLALSVAAGIVVVFVFKKLKATSLKKAVEKAEKQLPALGEEAAEKLSPMALTESEEVSDEEEEKQPQKETLAPRALQEDSVTEETEETGQGAAPDWLTGADKGPATPSAIEPAPLAPPPDAGRGTTPPWLMNAAPPQSTPESPESTSLETAPMPEPDRTQVPPAPETQADTTPPFLSEATIAPASEPAPLTPEEIAATPGALGTGTGDDATAHETTLAGDRSAVSPGEPSHNSALPPWLQPGAPRAAGDTVQENAALPALTQAQSGEDGSASQKAGKTPEQIDRERERKRKRRQRYRKNKRARQMTETGKSSPQEATGARTEEGDVKFMISADSIEEDNGKKEKGEGEEKKAA